VRLRHGWIHNIQRLRQPVDERIQLGSPSRYFGRTLPRALRTIGLRSRFLLHRNELIAQLFRLTSDLIF